MPFASAGRRMAAIVVAKGNDKAIFRNEAEIISIYLLNKKPCATPVVSTTANHFYIY
jgi:hypothetical protein